MIKKPILKTALLRASFWVICISISLSGYSQNERTITGTVTSNEGALVGVTIHNMNQNENAVTKKGGKFKIKANSTDIIVFTYIGYVSKEITVADQNEINVVLQNNTTEMAGVIVTALGIKRQTRALTYATQQISGDAINLVKDPGGNIMNSLSGKVANLVVTPAGSGPGGAARIVLRGNRSINGNNNALVVVDGVPIDNTMSTESSGGGSANTFATQIKSISSGYSGMDGASSIDPEDVESITVLQGPAAAALYGSRAANGALIVTTKSGNSGKIKINYDGGFSVNNPYLLNQFQNTYGRGNSGVSAATAAQSWGPKETTFPNNVKDFYQNGILLNNYISASGGTENIRGYLSYTNNTTSGIIPKNDLNRNNLNLRLSAQLIPKLTADVKITYLNQSIDHLPRLGDQGINNEVYIMPRDLSSDSLKHFEEIDPVTGEPTPIYWSNTSTFVNPYWEVNRMVVKQTRDRTILMGSLKYAFTDWLNLQARYSLDSYNDLITGSYYNGTTMDPFNTPGGLYEETAINHWERNVDLLLSGNNKLTKQLDISYNLGASLLDIHGGNTTTVANGLSVPNKFNFNFASNIGVTNVPIKKEIQSLYGNVQFDFHHLLYLNASLRNDWSSTLPSPYSYSYPSVGITGVLSDILHLPGWVSFAKVRAAFTNVGNDADPYELNQRYDYSPGAGNGFISRDDTKSINDLKPEQTKSFEVGTDWKFFDNRLGVDATIYKNNTINQLVLIGLPAASGYQTQYVNVGNIKNSGFELMLTGTPIRNNSFTWETYINFALNRNEVIKLKGGLTQTTLSQSTNFGQLIIKPGGSYGDIYGYGWAKDAKGQHLINDAGLPVATDDQTQKLGNFNPDYTIGWGNTFNYKKFTMSFQIDGRVGGIIVSGTDALMSFYGVSDYTTKFRDGNLVLTGVHSDGTANTTPINAEKLWTTLSDGGRSSGYDEFFAFDATNFRLRDLSLGYNFDVHHSLIKAIRLSLTGNNLFFLYRGKSLLDIPGIGKRKLPVDPESAIGTSNYQGIESGLPPVVRSFGLNLHLNF
ncbi:MAG: SusC/RagA family TonB-linked outer membrane protein [Ginsengibacter sp.]